MEEEGFSYSAVQGLVLHGAKATASTADPVIFPLAALGSYQRLERLIAEQSATERHASPAKQASPQSADESTAASRSAAGLPRGDSSLAVSEDFFIELCAPDEQGNPIPGELHERLQEGTTPTPGPRSGPQASPGEAVDTEGGRREAASAAEGTAGLPPPWSRWRTDTEERESSRPGRRPGTSRHPAPGEGAEELQSPFLRLHQEILDFARFVSPTAAEAGRRRAAVERVEAVVKSIWPSCEVKVFGSYATGLFLPTSDIDAVVLNTGCSSVPKGLKALAKALVGKAVAKSMQVIAHARVPIVKFVERESEISFDISFDVTNGPDAADFIQSAMKGMPPLRPLCLVLKLFLQQRGLNEVYTGGLGSYALLVMLMAHLQLHPSRRGRGSQLEGNLGVLLVDFFALYSQHLNSTEVGISLRRGGCFFSKRRWGLSVTGKPFLLSIDDPQTNNNDLGRGSFRIHSVRAAFKRACAMLTTASGPNSWWLLGRILRVDHVLAVRPIPPQGAPGALSASPATVGEADQERPWAPESQGFPRSSAADTPGVEQRGDRGRGGLKGKGGFWGSLDGWLKRPAGARGSSAPEHDSKKRKHAEEKKWPSASKQRLEEGRAASGSRGSWGEEKSSRRWKGDQGSGKRKRGRGWSHDD